jgi:hypothetical protein
VDPLTEPPSIFIEIGFSSELIGCIAKRDTVKLQKYEVLFHSFI